MADKLTKRCLMSLVIREMQLKTIMRCHSHPLMIPNVKKDTGLLEFGFIAGEKGKLINHVEN